jgi:biopolymer transport protein ExbB/TolQ
MSKQAGLVSTPILDWGRYDIEQRLLVPGGRYTKVNGLFAGFVAALLTAGFYGLLATPWLRGSMLDAIFTKRGPTQHATALLFFWCMVILAIKWSKIRFQRRALDLRVIPDEAGFVLSTATVDRVLDRLHESVDDPRSFLLLNRLVVALANLRNLGHVGDVDDILRSQAAQDEAAIDTSYALLQGFVWAIPVLGFIGTVLGLSEAIGQFSGVLGASQDVGQISSALKGVTAGLATAFDTTLVALVAALIVQLLMTVMRKSEEEFLDSAMEYGLRNVVGRLRIARD